MKTCTFEGCDRKYCALGFCKVHYNILKKEGKVRTIGLQGQRINYTPIRICTVPGCQKKHRAKGFCSGHWQQQKKKGSISHLRIHGIIKICSVSDCNNKSSARGYCWKHYKRWEKYGNPDVLLPKASKICAHIVCEDFARCKGLCQKHYQRLLRHGDTHTSYRRPRKSQYVDFDNVLKNKSTYSKADDAEILRELFSENNNYCEFEGCI